jgi:hypothetical protein
LIGVSTLPSVLVFFFIPFIPESPRYLLLNGRASEAEKEMREVARLNGAVFPDKVGSNRTELD